MINYVVRYIQLALMYLFMVSGLLSLIVLTPIMMTWYTVLGLIECESREEFFDTLKRNWLSWKDMLKGEF